MSRQWKKVLYGAFALGAFALGGILSTGLTPTPAAGAEQCEQDECERTCGYFSCHRHCVDNNGNNTACNAVGSNDCATVGC